MTANNKPGLTKEQSDVVKSIVDGRRVVARAGAGSGKTTTLVEAYAALIGRMRGTGNPYDRILAITFTNEAAYNLRKAVFRRTESDVRALLTDNISTIHSFCNKILSAHLVELSINPVYEITDEMTAAEEAYDLIDEMCSGRYASDAELRNFIADYGYEGRSKNSFKEAVYGTYCKLRRQGTRQTEVLRLLTQQAGKLSEFALTVPADGDKSGDLARRTADYMKSVALLLARYVAEFWAEYDRRKELNGHITYDDVIYYTHRLLSEHTGICEYYRNKFEYVMVDEFQDTDWLQYDIISMISRKGRQAFVGDPKQSIYEWRNADPSIMKTVEKEVSQDQNGSLLEMADNFRSSPELILFFNLLFSQVFKDSGISYFPMRHANSAITDSNEPAARIMLPGGSSAAERRENEAALVCSEISRMLSSDLSIYDEETGEQRKPCFSDMAVLFRSRGAIRIYESMLRKNGIPYIHVQSESFFEKDEVTDMINYLNHLAFPEDSFYKFISLRSPIFGCGDEALLTLSMNRFDVVKTAAELEGGDAQKMRLFSALDEFCAAHRNWLAHRLVSEVIARTKVDLVYLASRGGKQAYANMLKLQDMIMWMERDGAIGLAEVARLLSERAARGSGEGEYPLSDEASDAVRIMTVHASKGLEFPVVFVADSSRSSPNGRSETVYHRDLGIVPGAPRRTMEIGGCIRAVGESALEAKDDGRWNEEKRIFYVSLTRAKQFFYISRFDSRNKEDCSWNSLLSSAVPAPDGADALVVEPGCRLLFIRPHVGASHAVDTAKRVSAQLTYHVPPPARKTRQALRITVTELSDYMTCPYRRQFSQSVPSQHGTADRWAAKERGSMTHVLLESYDYGRASFPSNADLLVNAQLGDVTGAAEHFIRSEYGAAAASAFSAGELRREFPFRLRIGEHTISGKMDLVAQNGDETMILDYKTGELKGHRSEYGNQLMLYALTLSRLTGAKKFRLVSFGLDRPEETSEIRVSEDSIRSFEQLVSTALDGVAEGRCAPNPSPSNCSSCTWSNACTHRYDSASQTKINKI